MRKDDFDPMSYIESAFLDVAAPGETEVIVEEVQEAKGGQVPVFSREYTRGQDGADGRTSLDAPQPTEASRTLVSAIRRAQTPPAETVKLKTTAMNAPRPRRRRSPGKSDVIGAEVEQLWAQIPKNLKFLASLYDDDVTRKYYTTKFKESREQLITRLVDPELNLEDTARLLGVCPATVRRYTNRGWLPHHRTIGNQRRFRLSGIVRFIEEYGRNPD